MRAIVALLSREIYGVTIAVPDFPSMKSLRGMGMSDWPDLAERLTQKFDYVNTYYDRPPYFDITNPGKDRGLYDFILSSEVMEHVAPPVEKAFETLASLLKPNGLLIMTTPYKIGAKTAEHFPDLNESGLVKLGQQIVLINRRRDGTMETFEDLVFHGGVGATLEMRLFSKESLEQMLLAAGFSSVYFAAERWPDFGIDRFEEWSLPIAARMGNFRAPVDEITMSYVALERVRERHARALGKLEWARRIARRLGIKG
ncbi:MAG TPA: methyltransferase domain-containing protein [Bryobacteraceae bacterium]|nr:methyltransferase domain-containing protein [Bryobacteraceae bacterium]